MLIFYCKRVTGTNQKTGKPYDGYALEGPELIQGELRNDRAFVQVPAFERNPVKPGDIAEVLRSGEIYVRAVNAFDPAAIEEALRM